MRAPQHRWTKQEIIDVIDRESSYMTQEKALEFLEQLHADIDARIDGLRCDMNMDI
jgi:hypothetical protein